MSSRKTYHLTKTENGWQGKAENNERASITADTKAKALEKIREIAKNQNASLIIHKADGTFQEERTYPKSSDPYPPEG